MFGVCERPQMERAKSKIARDGGWHGGQSLKELT